MIKANAKRKNNGISLIVLIIIIVVILILASSVIFNLTKSNILENAEEAKFKQDIGIFKDELHLVISQEYLDNQGKRNETITALEYTKDGKKESVYTYLSSFTKEYENKIAIKDDKIVYIGNDKKEREWLAGSGLDMSKKITFHYKDGNGKKIKESDEIYKMDSKYKFEAPKIDGYIALTEVKEITVSSDIEVTFEYCTICNDLAFVGLDSNGNETNVEANIVSYAVSGIGECDNKYVAIPREYNGKNVIKIKSAAFQNNKSIKKLVIGDNIQNVGNSAFWGCANLIEVNINAGVLEQNSFRTCPNLVKAVLGKNVSKGINIFGVCTNLSDLTIYSETLNLDNTVIDCGQSLKVVKINEDNNTYKSIDGVVYSKDETKIFLYPQGKDGDVYEIPSNVKVIGYSSFRGCFNLKYIDIPETVEVLGDASFLGCGNLTEVNLNAKKIEQNAFRSCANLEKAVIGKNVESANLLFGVCNKLTDLTIYSEDININNNVIDSLTSLEKIKINEDNKTYKSIDGIVYSKDGTKIYAYPQGKKEDTFVFPNDVKIIGDSAFQNAKNLKHINIPENVESVGSNAFQGIQNLTEINVAAKVLNNFVFYGCGNLNKFVIGKNANTFGSTMFLSCNNLTEIEYLGTTEEWNKIQKDSRWNLSSKITTIKCNDGNVSL